MSEHHSVAPPGAPPRPGEFRRWLAWLPVVLWMFLIFVGSTDVLSETRTSRFLVPFLRWMVPGISPTAINRAQAFIRKSGHFTEYAVLAASVMFALRCSVPLGAGGRFRRHAALTILLCAVYAMSDEFHQSFIPTRQASVIDVLIDTSGATAAVLFWGGLRRLRRRRLQPGVEGGAGPAGELR